MRRGFSNMGRAVADPLKKCGYGLCVGSSIKRWQQQSSEWRREGLQNQKRTALARGDTDKAQKLERKIQGSGYPAPAKANPSGRARKP